MEKTIYRVIPFQEWEEALSTGNVPLGGADERDGFIHLSPANDLLETARLYFKPQEQPIALAIDAASLGDDLRWEAVASRDGTLFPHLYAKAIPLTAVTGKIKLLANENGGYRLGDAF